MTSIIRRTAAVAVASACLLVAGIPNLRPMTRVMATAEAHMAPEEAMAMGKG